MRNARRVTVACGVIALSLSLSLVPAHATSHRGIWINASELAELPTSGRAWNDLLQVADTVPEAPDLSDQDNRTNVTALAQALVYARTGEARYRDSVCRLISRAMGTEAAGRTLSLSRQLVSYVIAADLVGLPAAQDSTFRIWLRSVVDLELDGMTLRSTHERRPNNWGTHAGASRIATAMYLGLDSEVARCAQIFRGWLGNREAYSGFEFRARSWQADTKHPVGINPRGAMRDGHSIDGVLPDDQRRGGDFKWPPPRENYVYEALQGAVAQAMMLSRAGYPAWQWEDAALLRAFTWLHTEAQYPAAGDDTWMLPVVDRAYNTQVWDGGPTRPGKALGFTDWTHGK